MVRWRGWGGEDGEESVGYFKLGMGFDVLIYTRGVFGGNKQT